MILPGIGQEDWVFGGQEPIRVSLIELDHNFWAWRESVGSQKMDFEAICARKNTKRDSKWSEMIQNDEKKSKNGKKTRKNGSK